MKSNASEVPLYEVSEFRKKSTKYCICIPLLNEGDKFKKQLIRIKKIAYLADILILDGGSTDGSTNKTLLKTHGIRSLIIKKSAGKYSAQLRMGYDYALKQKYQGIIQMDGNNKDGTDGIAKFVKALDEGFDYIQGSRFAKGGEAINTPPLRWLGIRLVFSPLISLASMYWFTDITNGFRAYSAKLLLHPGVKPFRNLFDRYELLFYLPLRAAQLRLKIKEVPVTRSYPKDKIPTKITGLANHLDVIIMAFKTAFNFYNPK